MTPTFVLRSFIHFATEVSKTFLELYKNIYSVDAPVRGLLALMRSIINADELR